MDFSWAAYNAGPAKVARLRRAAGEKGYDPNRWFGSVELIALEDEVQSAGNPALETGPGAGDAALRLRGSFVPQVNAS